jgi:hypothetical protein
MTVDPIEVLGEWVENLFDPDVVDRLVLPESTYLSLNTDDSELPWIMPWTGTSRGPQAFLDNLGTSFMRLENQAFNMTTMAASGGTVAAFGDSATGPTRSGRRSHLIAVFDPAESHRRTSDLKIHLRAVRRLQPSLASGLAVPPVVLNLELVSGAWGVVGAWA